MKYISRFKVISILSLAILVSFTSCKEDDPDIPVVGSDYELRYDGGNDTAPPLAPGFYETGLRFAAGEDGNVAGVELFAVRYFIRNKPSSADINVYAGGVSEPFELLYTESITSEISSSSWNDHELTAPIVLDGDHLWITISYNQGDGDRVIGCDNGPRASGGDWHYDGNANEWNQFVDWTGGESINWNIRGQIRE